MRDPERPPTEPRYTWSSTRVFEQIVINVASWAIIGFIAAIAALLVQRFTHYVWVPTSILVIVVSVGAGSILTLVAIVATFAITNRRHPGILLALAVLFAIVSFLDTLPSHGRNAAEEVAGSVAEAMRQAGERMKAQDAAAAASRESHQDM